MPSINLGRVGGSGGDWAQNDQSSAAYIKNRPCYDNVEEITWSAEDETDSFAATLIDSGTGESKQITFHKISDRLPCAEDFDGHPMHFTAGIAGFDIEALDKRAFLEHDDGNLYGYYLCYFMAARRTGAFSVSFDGELSGDAPSTGLYVAAKVDLTYVRLTLGQKKRLDVGLLPEGTSPVKVVDIGSADFDPSTFDFSQFQPGDVILIAGDGSIS